MNKILPIIICLFVISVTGQTVRAQEAVGQVTALEGRATAVDTRLNLRTLQLSDDVFLHDLIQTDAGAKIQIKFIDGSLLGQGERSQIRINTYVFNPAGRKKPRAGLRLLKGVFRLITDKITRQNPEGYEVETNYGTIGIRGCELCFLVEQDGEEEVQVVGLHHADSVFIRPNRSIPPSATGAAVIDQDMKFVTMDKKQGLSPPADLPPSRVSAIYAETTPVGASIVVPADRDGGSPPAEDAGGDEDAESQKQETVVASGQKEKEEDGDLASEPERQTVVSEDEEGGVVIQEVEEWEEDGEQYRKTVTTAKQVVEFDQPDVGSIDDIAQVDLDPASAAPTRFIDSGSGVVDTRRDVVLDVIVPEAIVDESVLVMPEPPPTVSAPSPPDEPVVDPPVSEEPVVVAQPEPMEPLEEPSAPAPPAGPEYPIVGPRVYTVLQEGANWSYEQWEQETIDLVNGTPESTFKFGTRVQGDAIRGTEFLDIRDGAQIYTLSGLGGAAAAVTKGMDSFMMEGLVEANVTIGATLVPSWDAAFDLSSADGESLGFNAAGSFDNNGQLQGTVSGYSLSTASGNPVSQSISGNLVGPGTGPDPITGVAGEFDFSHTDGTVVDGVFGADLQ